MLKPLPASKQIRTMVTECPDTSYLVHCTVVSFDILNPIIDGVISKHFPWQSF